MKEIKTKENYNKINSVDKTIKVSQRINGAYIKAKDRTTRATESNQDSVYEYADETLANMVQETTTSTEAFAKRNIRRFIQKKKEINVKKRNGDNKIPEVNEVSSLGVLYEKNIQDKDKNKFINNKIKSKPIGVGAIKEKIVDFIKGGHTVAINSAKIAIANTKVMIAALLGVGSIGVFFAIIICTIALVMGSSFGIFMSKEDTGTGYTVNSVVQMINAEYLEEIKEIKSNIPHDDLVVIGEPAKWKDVLAIYAVKVTTANEGSEVVTIDKEKIEAIRNIYRFMTDIESKVEAYEEKQIVEIEDEEGNITEQEIIQIKTRLIISTKNKTATETADEYKFDKSQKNQLEELLSIENDDLWKLDKKG